MLTLLPTTSLHVVDGIEARERARPRAEGCEDAHPSMRHLSPYVGHIQATNIFTLLPLFPVMISPRWLAVIVPFLVSQIFVKAEPEAWEKTPFACEPPEEILKNSVIDDKVVRTSSSDVSMQRVLTLKVCTRVTHSATTAARETRTQDSIGALSSAVSRPTLDI